MIRKTNKQMNKKFNNKIIKTKINSEDHKGLPETNLHIQGFKQHQEIKNLRK